MKSQVGYQPRNTPAERRAFFERLRFDAEATKRLKALEDAVADLTDRVEALEGP